MNELPVRFWSYLSRNAKGLQLKLIENISFHHRLKCCLESLEQSCLENIVEAHRTEKH